MDFLLIDSAANLESSSLLIRLAKEATSITLSVLILFWTGWFCAVFSCLETGWFLPFSSSSLLRLNKKSSLLSLAGFLRLRLGWFWPLRLSLSETLKEITISKMKCMRNQKKLGSLSCWVGTWHYWKTKCFKTFKKLLIN